MRGESRKISAARDACALRRAVSLRRGLPLVCQSSGDCSPTGEEGIKIIWIAVPVQTTLMCGTQRTRGSMGLNKTDQVRGSRSS